MSDEGLRVVKLFDPGRTVCVLIPHRSDGTGRTSHG